MDFFRGLTGGSANSAEPPASVLAEWNKYSAGDIESQSAGKPASTAQPSFFAGLQESVQVATNSATASMALYGTQGGAGGGGGGGFGCEPCARFAYTRRACRNQAAVARVYARSDHALHAV